jgi:hypothetical protein
MGCFSAAWLVQFIVWLIVVCAIVAIGRRVLPIVLGWLGVAGEVVMQVIVDCHGRDAGVAVGAGVSGAPGHCR